MANYLHNCISIKNVCSPVKAWYLLAMHAKQVYL